jgi:predicted DNA-binding transcriptional regulator YafY
MNRTDRLMGMLLELQVHRELRAEDLARRFEVSVRTVYRDLQALSETGVPLAATPGTGYRLMDGYFLPPLSFTADEAAVLALGGTFVRERVDPALRDAADEALRKLTAVLPQQRREAVDRWRRQLVFPSLAPQAHEQRLAQLRAAIEERRVVRLLYHAFRRAEPEARDVEPVSLVYLAEAWHLAAYCRLRRDQRLFRFDRIDQLESLDERYTPGERHRVGPPHAPRAGFPEVRVRFDRHVERWVREGQPFVFLREELDAAGPVFVYALRDERALAGWVLSWGAAAEVLDPPAFRARIAAEARAIAARHADPTNLDQFAQAAPTPDRMVSGAPL